MLTKNYTGIQFFELNTLWSLFHAFSKKKKTEGKSGFILADQKKKIGFILNEFNKWESNSESYGSSPNISKPWFTNRLVSFLHEL